MFLRRVTCMSAVLCGMLSAFPTGANSDQRERWTLSTQAGTATLALVPEAGAPPAIMFVCSVRYPGVAQVIISRLDPGLVGRRLRIDLETATVSAMALAEPSSDLVSRHVAALGEISIEQMTAILQSSSALLNVRIDASNDFGRPHMAVPLPHALSRHRTEFLRFCA